MAEALRAEGNALLRAGDAAGAVRKYTAALETQVTDAERAVLLNNRAAAGLKAGRHADALVDAAGVLRIDGTSQKGLFRKAQALSGLADRHAEAVRAGASPEVLTEQQRAAAAESGEFGKSCGAVGDSEWDLRLAAQEALTLLSAAGGGKDAGVRSALNAAREAALFAAVRGPVEVRRDGAHSGGIGLFTVRATEPGEVLLEDDPVVFQKGDDDWQARGRKMVEELQSLQSSDPRKLEWVLGLHNPAPDGETVLEKLYCIWDANGHSVGDVDFRVDEDTAVGVALYVAASRVNHSCAPNAVQIFCPRTARIRLHALDGLEAGAEVLISYCAPYASTASRREKLKFDCRCRLCLSCEQDQLGGGDPADIRRVKDAIDKAQLLAKDAQQIHNDPKRRFAVFGEAQRLALAAAEDSAKTLGNEHEISFGATLLCVKLCAGAGSALALPHARRLRQLSTKHLHPRWPLQVSALVHLAVQEGLACPDNEAELLPHLLTAFQVHRSSIGCPFPDDSSRRPGDEVLERDDAVGYFWRRYRAELSALEIDSVDRARALFSSCAP